MVHDYTADGTKKTHDALKYFVEHSGDMDVACGDGITPRKTAELVQARHP
jgi:hypothetical protein